VKPNKPAKVIGRQRSAGIDLAEPVQLFKADEREELQDSVTGMTSTVAADETGPPKEIGLPNQVLVAFSAMPLPIQFEDPRAVQERADAKANAELGMKMRAGRKEGTVGAVRKAIQRVLKDRPTATTAEVWSVIKARPPKGMAFFESTNPKLGKYIETSGNADTSYRRFANIVSEEKKATKSK
jgi:hypothetical protein